MPTTTANINGILINEVSINPSGLAYDLNGDNVTNAHDEFVELFNSSAGTIDISGWEIWEKNELKHTIPGGTTLGTGEYYVSVDVAGGTANPIQNVNGSDAHYTDANYNLTSSDVIMLYNPGTNTFIVYQSSSASASGTASNIADLVAAHPGATQVGPTEQTPTEVAGTTSSRATDGDTTFTNITPTPGAANCFAPGTRIATPDGECLVEDLQVGDKVLTRDGTAVPVKFNLQQRVTLRGVYAQRMEPVCITAGALGVNTPHSDLIVSADHGMVLDGLVINASALVNGNTIRFVKASDLPPRLTYYHIETAAHDVIFANGAQSESFVDAGSRKGFYNYQAYLDLYEAEHIVPEMPLPRITAQRLLPQAIKARLGLTHKPETALRA